jgi:hypothetical protein
MDQARAIKAAVNASPILLGSINADDPELRVMADVDFSLSKMTNVLDDALKPFQTSL